jgi:peptidoglycan hydrolase-like protein with peptidoglycan-binding domain
MVYALGVDFSFGNGVTTEQLSAHGVQFVCRYMSGGDPKDITLAEYLNYKNAGIEVVLNWETAGQLEGYGLGATHAQTANNQAKAITGVDNAPIIFSSDLPQLYSIADNLEYMQAVHNTIGYDRTGMYGCFEYLAAYFNQGLGAFGWQTSGGSYGQWDTRAQLQQYQYNVYIGGAETDLDRAMAANFGQVGATAPATPVLNNSGGFVLPSIMNGATGTPVRVLQFLLGVTIDGDFGPETEAAVKSFQSAHKLTVDGIVGPNTWGALV